MHLKSLNQKALVIQGYIPDSHINMIKNHITEGVKRQIYRSWDGFITDYELLEIKEKDDDYVSIIRYKDDGQIRDQTITINKQQIISQIRENKLNSIWHI